MKIEELWKNKENWGTPKLFPFFFAETWEVAQHSAGPSANWSRSEAISPTPQPWNHGDVTGTAGPWLFRLAVLLGNVYQTIQHLDVAWHRNTSPQTPQLPSVATEILAICATRIINSPSQGNLTAKSAKDYKRRKRSTRRDCWTKPNAPVSMVNLRRHLKLFPKRAVTLSLLREQVNQNKTCVVLGGLQRSHLGHLMCGKPRKTKGLHRCCHQNSSTNPWWTQLLISCLTPGYICHTQITCAV